MVKLLAPDMKIPLRSFGRSTTANQATQAFVFIDLVFFRSGILRISIGFRWISEGLIGFRRCKSEPLSKSLNSKWVFHLPSLKFLHNCEKIWSNFTKVPMMKYRAFSGGFFHRIPHMVPWEAPQQNFNTPPRLKKGHGMQCHASCKSFKKNDPSNSFGKQTCRKLNKNQQVAWKPHEHGCCFEMIVVLHAASSSFMFFPWGLVVQTKMDLKKVRTTKSYHQKWNQWGDSL